MAVVTRARKGGKKVFYVTVQYAGHKYWERAGKDVREARRLNRLRLQEVRDGTFTPHRASALVTVAKFGEEWLAKRTARWADGATYLRRYILESAWLGPMKIEDVRKRHGLDMLDELRLVISKATGQPLAEKTVANILGMARTMLQTAVDRELIPTNPFALPRGSLDRESGKKRGTYDTATIRKMLGHAGLTPTARVFASLAFYTGMREGELCGRRWKDYDAESKPLGALRCWSQYNDRPLKTAKRLGARERNIPVHPVLAEVLAWWMATGWELVHLRAPTPDDFIVPRRKMLGHTKSSAYKLWRAACETAGVANVSLHSTRHTFVTMARRGGGREDVVEKLTHNAGGSMLDQYTHWEWAPLCEAMLCVHIGALVTNLVTPSSELPALPGESVVEAPGIEPGRDIGTVENDADGQENDADAEHPSSPIIPRLPESDCAARHQAGARFPLHEAVANLACLLAGVSP